MQAPAPQPIRLADYRPYPFTIVSLDMRFDLDPEATRVTTRMVVERKAGAEGPMVLNGERLELLSLKIDGAPVAEANFILDRETLTLTRTPARFTLETEVRIHPAANTALEGLYVSGDRFCTQCEAEGFRKITYYPDRPDVLTRYRVTLEGPATLRHLLSNGNCVDTGLRPDGRAYAVWEDPFPKPCYLFALVAGSLDVLEDRFVTMSGREVVLRIFVDEGQSGRALYAMDALKRAMAWDEQAFGREYDLDLFMIVAVRDFNFGAMENKGLNIFNASLVLADAHTATDLDFERIESVVAHEYFHNWTGNRITCRDWFQLCLKEGLTVFRDQSFSADQRGAAVQRIKDVKMLRGRQFPEDAGPIAHPVRPSSYVKIDNFYTATIYEKGAEIIRMLRLIVGEAAFRAGMDLYFDRHDGEATTVEAFIRCFEAAADRDLSHFFVWYEQAGTPALQLGWTYAADTQELTVSLRQDTPAAPGQSENRPLPIPIRLGFLEQAGGALPVTWQGETASEHLIVLDSQEAQLTFAGVACEPVLSPLRGFSAPVRLVGAQAPSDLYCRMAADEDLFNRWEAAQSLASDLILARSNATPDLAGEARFAKALGRSLEDARADFGFRALMLALPTESDLAQAKAREIDPAAIHAARNHLRATVAKELGEVLHHLHETLVDTGPFSPLAAAAGRRALRNAALDMLCAAPDADTRASAVSHFGSAVTMTDQIGGLAALMALGGELFEQALKQFYVQWRADPLVIDKWFQIQARDPSADAMARVERLLLHPDFDRRTPNRMRALVQGFSVGNPAKFHAPNGEGYAFLAREIALVDAINPSTAARLLEPLCGWKSYIPSLGAQMRAELEGLAKRPETSKNVLELTLKALDA